MLATTFFKRTESTSSFDFGRLFFILEGKVSVSTYKSHDEKITELSASAVIGEIALMDDGLRSATVASAGKTRVGVIAAR